MKRISLVFAGGLIVLVSLSACGNVPTAEPTSPAATSMPPTDTAEPAPLPATDTPVPTDPPASEEPAAGASVSFSAEVLPVLQSRCAGCHGGQRTEKGLNLLSYEAVITGSENGAVLVPGDAANSKLSTLVAEGKMPKRGPKLTPDQVQLIVDWINAGALNN